MNELRKQIPSNPDNWLYKDQSETERQFSKLVYLGIDDEPWLECTNEEKEEWEHREGPEEPQDNE